jgi:deoxyadenosine kinase
MTSSAQRHYISISGLIGAGKSTLADALGAAMELPVYHEPVADNPYLELFYGDMRKYAFPMQIWLLNARFRQQQEIIWAKRGAVQDRSIYEDSIFASMLERSGLMESRDYNTYTGLFDNMSSFMRTPTMIVWLDVEPTTAYARIKARGRACEVDVTLDYLVALHAAYDSAMVRISRTIPVLRVQYERFHDVDAMVAAICASYESACNVHDVTIARPQASTSE